MKKISIVSSCYNEENNLDELFNRVFAQIDKYKDKYEFEYILLDNGSTDHTADKLREWAQKDKRIKVIINSRNFGSIKAPVYGVMQCFGDAVITIVSDLQDPPELIPELIKKWEEGYKSVFLKKLRSGENPLMFAIRKLYYFLLNKINDNGVELVTNCTGSGLYDKAVVDELRKIDDPYPFFRGLMCEIGFKRAYVQFEQPARKRGISSNNLYGLYDVGMTGIIKFSKLPLRLMAFFGFGISVITFLLAVFYLVWKLLHWQTFSFGVAPIIISILFLGAVQLFCLGILGEYIGAIYTRVDKKPLVVEAERINF